MNRKNRNPLSRFIDRLFEAYETEQRVARYWRRIAQMLLSERVPF